MIPRPLRLERVSNFARPKLSNFARSKSLTLNFGQHPVVRVSTKCYTIVDMDNSSTHASILNRINGSMKGKCFSRSDFADLGSRLSISQALSRLESDGIIISPLRGYYCKPKISKLIGEVLPPDYNELATAIARNYGWTILPCGDILLNNLGLTTQVPVTWTYVSTGPYREYVSNGTVITFKHTANREMFNMSRTSAMIIQALKTLGKANITNQTVAKLRTRLTKGESRRLAEETIRTTSWIFEIIKMITEAH